MRLMEIETVHMTSLNRERKLHLNLAMFIICHTLIWFSKKESLG